MKTIIHRTLLVMLTLLIGLTDRVNAGAPTAPNIRITTREDSPIEKKIAATDPDRDPLSFVTIRRPQFGYLYFESSVPGRFYYDPDYNFHGTDSFTYQVSDGVNSSVGTVSITVTSVNDLPYSIDWETARQNRQTSLLLQTSKNQSLSQRLVIADSDSASTQLVVVTRPTHGILTLTNPGAGEFTYAPRADFVGVDKFSLKAVDSDQGRSGSIPITVEISDAVEPALEVYGPNGFKIGREEYFLGTDSSLFQPDFIRKFILVIQNSSLNSKSLDLSFGSGDLVFFVNNSRFRRVNLESQEAASVLVVPKARNVGFYRDELIIRDEENGSESHFPLALEIKEGFPDEIPVWVGLAGAGNATLATKALNILNRDFVRRENSSGERCSTQDISNENCNQTHLIKFYLSGVEKLAATIAEINDTDSNALLHLSERFSTPGRINLFMNKILANGRHAGEGNLGPRIDYRTSMIVESLYAAVNSTVSHEMGHVIGLEHTSGAIADKFVTWSWRQSDPAFSCPEVRYLIKRDRTYSDAWPARFNIMNGKDNVAGQTFFNGNYFGAFGTIFKCWNINFLRNIYGDANGE